MVTPDDFSFPVTQTTNCNLVAIFLAKGLKSPIWSQQKH